LTLILYRNSRTQQHSFGSIYCLSITSLLAFSVKSLSFPAVRSGRIAHVRAFAHIWPFAVLLQRVSAPAFHLVLVTLTLLFLSRAVCSTGKGARSAMVRPESLPQALLRAFWESFRAAGPQPWPCVQRSAGHNRKARKGRGKTIQQRREARGGRRERHFVTNSGFRRC
jgi:hypothetical protein